MAAARTARSVAAMPRSGLAPNPPAVRLRPVSPADEPLLRGLLDRVTGESRWTRFFTGGVDLDRVARMEARCDDRRRFGVLALDALGLVRDANPAAERLFGRPADQLRGTALDRTAGSGEFVLDATPPVDRRWRAVAFGTPWNGWATPIVTRETLQETLDDLAVAWGYLGPGAVVNEWRAGHVIHSPAELLNCLDLA